jgi:tricorn protease interacting factor F2/3
MKKSSILPTHISPDHYDISLAPDLEKFIFPGSVKIKINLYKPSNKIILNSKELEIKSAIISHNNEILKPNFSLNEKDETLTLSLPKNISKEATISIQFEGKLNDSLAGFYRSKYLHNKKEKFLATTQFEAPYARKCFPCFDQPDKKATFTLSLLIDKKFEAISNMPIKSQAAHQNHSLITFKKTPVMSTYLLYIGVGEFEYIKSKYKNVDLRIITTPGKSKQGKLALDLTKKFLKYFETYSGIPYPLPKLDLIAIPDFNAGAMENWGAITFREVLLLFDKKKTSLVIKQRIAEVIAHELWHQWSGNLVTMKWWDDLWLNESFATYMAFKALDHYFPKWEIWEDFASSETNRAFEADMLSTTHPIAVHVSSPNQIEEIFDAISYSKGGSVLRMIESYLGHKTFQKGVSNYLKNYKYENAEAKDLWNHLSKVSKAPIRQIMESWINQKGFPIIHVKQSGSTLHLSQKRFNSTSNTLWKIPLTIKTNSTTIKTLLTKKTQSLSLPKNTEWYKLNTNQEGFYKTEYPVENLNKLKTLIAKKKLSTIDRWEIQNDLFSLALIGEIPITPYLDFIKSYNTENNSFVLQDIFGNMGSIYFLFSQTPEWKSIWPKYKYHIQDPFRKALKDLTWNPKKNESNNASLLRPLSISYLSFSEDKATINEGFGKFKKFLKDSHSLHADIKGPVLYMVAKHGDNSSLNLLLDSYLKAQNPEEKVKLLASLYRTKSPSSIKKSLDFSLTKKVRSQDLRTVFAIVGSNPHAQQIFFKWVKQNWPKLKQYKKASFVFMGLIESLITSYTGKQKEAELRKFLNSKKVRFKQTQANAFETLRINTRFLETNKKHLQDYFK